MLWLSLLRNFIQQSLNSGSTNVEILKCDNHKEALALLQNRIGNTQQIIAAHMNALAKMRSVDNKDLSELRKHFDDVTSHV